MLEAVAAWYKVGKGVERGRLWYKGVLGVVDVAGLGRSRQGLLEDDGTKYGMIERGGGLALLEEGWGR